MNPFEMRIIYRRLGNWKRWRRWRRWKRWEIRLIVNWLVSRGR